MYVISAMQEVMEQGLEICIRGFMPAGRRGPETSLLHSRGFFIKKKSTAYRVHKGSLKSNRGAGKAISVICRCKVLCSNKKLEIAWERVAFETLSPLFCSQPWP